VNLFHALVNLSFYIVTEALGKVLTTIANTGTKNFKSCFIYCVNPIRSSDLRQFKTTN
jgi:hypothetical protein